MFSPLGPCDAESGAFRNPPAADRLTTPCNPSPLPRLPLGSDLLLRRANLSTGSILANAEPDQPLAPRKPDSTHVARAKISTPNLDGALQRLVKVLAPATVLSARVAKPSSTTTRTERSIRKEARRVRFAFVNTDITEVVDTISKIAGNNIIVPPTLEGKVTLHLRDVPVLTALNAAVKQLGHTVVELDRGILHITKLPAEPVRPP